MSQIKDDYYGHPAQKYKKSFVVVGHTLSGSPVTKGEWDVRVSNAKFMLSGIALTYFTVLTISVITIINHYNQP